MADHAITLASGQTGTSPDETGMVLEDVQVVGTAGTSGTYTTQMKQPLRVIGGFSYSISGQVVTLTSAAFTGTMAARILGYQ